MSTERKVLQMFKPSYMIEDVPEGVKVTVTAPAMFGGKVTPIIVSPQDAARIDLWLSGGVLIQNALPHWSASQRELLLTGIDDAAWEKMAAEDENDD